MTDFYARIDEPFVILSIKDLKKELKEAQCILEGECRILS